MGGGVQKVLEAIVVGTPSERVEAVAGLDAAERADLLALRGSARAQLASALAVAIESGQGEGAQRLLVGELLGLLGDPRLKTPADADYWVHLEPVGGDAFAIGRHMVTNAEFRIFVREGGYQNDALWSAEGRAWREATGDLWPVLAAGDDVAELVVDNQPVVGVSYYEAEAYANAVGGRLPTWAERQWAVRGVEKRKYPWGSPFGDKRANTREERLGRPCAVGLYRGDVTPEGIFDLAGNAGEWTSEKVGDEALLHPGSWEQPSLASWAKASTTADRGDRWPALGFRIAKDA